MCKVLILWSLLFSSALVMADINNPLESVYQSQLTGITFIARCNSSDFLSIPNLLEKMHGFAESALVEGLEKLEKYNPGLACQIKMKLAERPFILDCKYPFRRKVYAITFPHIWGNIGLSKYKRTVRMPSLAASFYRDELLKEYPWTFSAEAKKIHAEDKIFQKSVIFHEALHVAGVKNQSMVKHNSSSGREREQDDLVFSCARLVFPAQITGYSSGKKDNEFFYLSHKNCMVCASAKIGGECGLLNQPIDPQEQCKEIKDLLFFPPR